MSYTVTINNSTDSAITTEDGTSIQPNGSWTSGTLGNTFAHSDQFGPISFIDLGENHIPGDSGETWGVLITYQGEHMVGRYEGGGQLTVDFNAYLQATLTGMDLRLVALNPLGEGGQPAASAE